jgi:outer membrane biosynthesis protein TonB
MANTVDTTRTRSSGPAHTAGTGGAVGGVLGGIGDKPIPASEAAFPPVPIKRITPTYPMEARIKDIEGEVVLEMILDKQGDIVGPISVKQSIPLLDQAGQRSLEVVAIFAGARPKQQPVILDVPLRFVLE